MASSDPSQVDTPTLIRSARHDVEQAMSLVWDAHKWLTEARATVAELERRALKDRSDG